MDINRVIDLKSQLLDTIYWYEIDGWVDIPAESQISDEFHDGYNIRWWRAFYASSMAYGIIRFIANEAELAGFDVFELPPTSATDPAGTPEPRPATAGY